MSMDFSTSIQSFNTEFNLNAIKDYNKFLNKQNAFEFDTQATEFSKALDHATKSIPLKDKNDTAGIGLFANEIGNTFGNALNAVNDAKLYSYNQENGNDILTVFLKTSMLNYIEDIETSQIVEGSKLKRKDKYFLITFIRPKYETINGKIVVKCKGCGAPNTILENGKCEYCATNIATGDYDWLIEDIKNFEM